MKKNRKEILKPNSWISIGDLMIAVLSVFIVFYIVQTFTINKERSQYYKILSGLDKTRNNIINTLKNDKSLNLNIDSKTGVITLNSEILFESNNYELKVEGKEFLKNFIPKYISILVGNESNRQYLKQIIIEGHTDKQGSYIYNLNLSQKRALSVVEYISSAEIGDFDGKKEMNKYMTANGRSFIDYLGPKNSIIDPQSRRVVFKFILKDDDAINELRELLDKGIGGESNVK